MNLGRHILTGVFLGIWASAAQAAPTPAATIISNIATLNYDVGGTPESITSNAASFTVDELIDVALTWQDAGPVSVNSPDTDKPLTFLLSNIGNGPESFSLSLNNSLAGDAFDPNLGASGSIYLENGLQAGFQASGPNADTIYIPGTNDPNLAAGASRTIYVNSNIPASLSNGNTGLVKLTASSRTPGAAGAMPGITLPGQGVGGVNAVIGSTRAEASQNGSYLVSGLTVTVDKAVLSPPDPIQPGSILNYRITVTVSGSGTAANLVITDPLPAELTFVPGSIVISAADSDDTAQFSSNTVTVNFGNTVAPATRIFTFSITVK